MRYTEACTSARTRQGALFKPLPGHRGRDENGAPIDPIYILVLINFQISLIPIFHFYAYFNFEGVIGDSFTSLRGGMPLLHFVDTRYKPFCLGLSH